MKFSGTQAFIGVMLLEVEKSFIGIEEDATKGIQKESQKMSQSTNLTQN